MPRASFYIDGFNLYHSLKGHRKTHEPYDFVFQELQDGLLVHGGAVPPAPR
jgi:hypothetical protein